MAHALLGPAALLLEGHGYATHTVFLEGDNRLLLAENAYSAIGIAEFATAAELPGLALTVAGDLVDRLNRSSGAKRWDAYLVLLSTSVATESSMPEAVANIVYNMRFLRRIVRWNVPPDEPGIARALRPFLPLTAASSGGQVTPVTLLSRNCSGRWLYGLAPSAGIQGCPRKASRRTTSALCRCLRAVDR
jgi:hypothetical protein